MLLASLAAMLISGPTAGLASGAGIFLGDLRIGGPETHSPAIYAIAVRTHSSAAAVLAIGVVVHVAGVLKHVLIDRDSTLARMLSPNAASAAP